MKTTDLTNVQKALQSWGGHCPDWVIVMAEVCDATSQGIVGKRLKYTSGSVCSSVLKNKYAGDMDQVEKRVRGELMSATVKCPKNGDILMAVCLDHQDHAKNENRSSSFRAAMIQACRQCPIARIGQKPC